MSNAITQGSSHLDLSDRETCLALGRSGKQALLDSARGYVTHHGPIEEWAEEMGLAASTTRRYKTTLRKEGEFPHLKPKGQCDNPDAVRMRNKRASEQKLSESKCSPQSQSPQPLAEPEPTPTLDKPGFTSPLQTVDGPKCGQELIDYWMSIPEKDYDPDLHGHPGKDSNDPYPRAMYLFDQLITHLRQNSDNLTDSEWLSLCGHAAGITSTLHPRRDLIKRSQRNRADAIDVESSEVT